MVGYQRGDENKALINANKINCGIANKIKKAGGESVLAEVYNILSLSVAVAVNISLLHGCVLKSALSSPAKNLPESLDIPPELPLAVGCAVEASRLGEIVVSGKHTLHA